MADFSTIEQVFRPLLPALTYGARDGFAHLSTLRSLEKLICNVAEQARQAGVDPGLVERLLVHGRGFDAADPTERRAAVEGIARELSGAMPLPEPLKSIASGREPPRERAPPRRTATEERELFASAATPSRVKVDRLRRAPRKRDTPSGGLRAVQAAEAEVIYPSLPRAEGPLATPLSEVATLRGRLRDWLAERGISKAGELLFFLPRAYEDRRQILPIARLRVGERGVSVGTVKVVHEAFFGRRRVLKVVLGDPSGSIAATWYHYQPWMKKRFTVGEQYLFSGEVRAFGGTREIAHPELEKVETLEGDGANFGRIVPVYPGVDFEQRTMRALTQRVVEQFAAVVADPLPPQLVARAGLPPLGEAVRQVHFPDGVELTQLASHQLPGQRRLAFDELFFIQLGLELRRSGVKLTPGVAFNVDRKRLEKAAALLPFKLTAAQQRALGEIAGDMGRPEPMNRLLQGDVGSGKTAVAMIAAVAAVESGYQASFMAPTEILAEQHYRTLSGWLEPAGYKVALLTAGVAKKKKDEVKEALASGQAQVVVGTHALLQEDVAFRRLGLVVIDEQHRFGVLQRAKLMQKGVRPDVLVMTATPIPRTLAMTLYGDMEVSILDELPPGRSPVSTKVFSERQREKAYALVQKELALGRQAFVVYPLVEESEKVDLASATEGAQRLAEVFAQHRVGLIHGRMPVEEKQQVMEQFRGGHVHVLVSTTVVEVGVDVPNATVMVVEAAERFGLSQLHQLRGRVGRGTGKSHCLLIGAAWRNQDAMQRLAVMERTTDGFVIAEEDLQIRGPGEFLGTRQSGVPGLSVADLTRDQDLLALAKREAARLCAEDPRLTQAEHLMLRRTLDERWEGRLGLAQVG